MKKAEMTKPLLVCFIGIDGAGKTTLAKVLSSELQKNGLKNKYVYGRFVSPILNIIIKFIKASLSLRVKRINDFNYRSNLKKDVLKKPILAKSYEFFIHVN